MAWYPRDLQYCAFTRNSAGTTWKTYQQGTLVDTLTGFTQPSAADVEGAVSPGSEHYLVLGTREQGTLGVTPECALIAVRITTAEKDATVIKREFNKTLGGRLGKLP